MHVEATCSAWDESLYGRVSKAFTAFFAKRHKRSPVIPSDHILGESELEQPYMSGRFRGAMRQCEIDEQRKRKGGAW